MSNRAKQGYAKYAKMQPKTLLSKVGHGWKPSKKELKTVQDKQAIPIKK